MQKSLRTLGLATLLAVGATSTAMANNESGFYAQGNVGWTKTNLEYMSFLPATNKNTGFGGGAALGYKFNENIALELDYARYADVKFSVRGDEVVRTKNNQSVSLVGKFIAPFDNGFNIFAKAGFAYVSNETVTEAGYEVDKPGKNNRIAGVLGVGAGYFIHENVELVAQATTTTKDAPIPAMMSVTGGVAFHFG
jgi:opacity protein-like surface antigen